MHVQDLDADVHAVRQERISELGKCFILRGTEVEREDSGAFMSHIFVKFPSPVLKSFSQQICTPELK